METAATIDDVLPLVGEFNLHQILSLAVLSLLTIPASYQSLIIYFIADNPPWRCVANSTTCTFAEIIKPNNKQQHEFRCKLDRSQWEYVETDAYSIVTQFGLYCAKENLIFVATSIFFAGMAVGCIAIGWGSDRFGRKKVMIPCTVMALLIAFISSFSPSYNWFAASRFLIGLCAPGTIALFFVLTSEMVKTKYRPLAGITLWVFFTFSTCFMGVLAIYVREWKYLMLYSTAPYLLFLPLLFFIPESLRWLHVSGRIDEAQKVIKEIARVNGRPNVVVHLSPAKVTHHSLNPMLLFSSVRMTAKSCNIGFAWLVSGLVYYGITLASNDLSGHIYRDYIFSSFVELPASVIAIMCSMYVGRKRTTQIPMFLGGLCCGAVSGIHELVEDTHLKNTRVALGMFGKLFITISYDVIYTWTMELYPTQIRTEAMGYVLITSRIGGMLSPWISKWLHRFHWRIPFAVMGVIAVISALFLEWLPETRLLKTAEVLEDSFTSSADDTVQELKPAGSLKKNKSGSRKV